MDKKFSTHIKSLLRGLMCVCPNCSRGKLFKTFLKSANYCTNCNQAFFYHQADDMPAYIVVSIVVHIIVPVTVWIAKYPNISYWLYLAIGIPFGFLLALLLIQPVKGAIIALQWSLGLHGFDGKDN